MWTSHLLSACGATFADAYARTVRDAHAIGLRVVLNYGYGRLPASVAGAVDRVMQEDAPRASQARDLTLAGAFLAWTEVALWPIDIDINSGDSGCAGVPTTSVCFHYGTFPELTGVRRGSAVSRAPTRSRCHGHSTTACLWQRRWSLAVVAVNETPRPIRAVLRVGATCRRVVDVWSGRRIAAGRCVRRFGVTIPPHSGRVYQEAARP